MVNTSITNVFWLALTRHTQAAESPFFGVYGGYTRKTDPWRNSLPPNVLSDTRQYLETWYRAAALWLKRKGGPRWRVDHVFLWNLNSWDVQVSCKHGYVQVLMQKVLDCVAVDHVFLWDLNSWDVQGGCINLLRAYVQCVQVLCLHARLLWLHASRQLDPLVCGSAQVKPDTESGS